MAKGEDFARMIRLEVVLRRVRLGLCNLLEFRKMTNGRYGNLTKEEIEDEIALIDKALE